MRLADPFITGTFNPKEKITVNRQRITFAQYAARMNIKSRARSLCRDEKDVREVLDEIWQNLSKSREVLIETLSRNQSVFEFEKALVK